MIDWTKSMQQTFEYYIVDPGTWGDKEQITDVVSCNISRQLNSDTLGSATFEFSHDIGEAYVRVYMVATQDKNVYKIPLGTYLVQSPSSSFDGKRYQITADAYTPLLELKEKYPPIGYYIPRNTNIMNIVGTLTAENVRAPVVKTTSSEKMTNDFIADTSETWLSYLSDALTSAKYQYNLDENGRVLFSKIKDTEALQPRYTFDDGNSSILLPSITVDNDIYGIPNVVEVAYSGDFTYKTRIVNNDKNSATSTVSRGREIVHRVNDLSIVGDPTIERIKEYATELLKEMSSIEYKVTYTHGYCPVRIGDCVMLNYTRAGFQNVKAKVIEQSFNCRPGCSVTETALITSKLWR